MTPQKSLLRQAVLLIGLSVVFISAFSFADGFIQMKGRKTNMKDEEKKRTVVPATPRNGLGPDPSAKPDKPSVPPPSSSAAPASSSEGGIVQQFLQKGSDQLKSIQEHQQQQKKLVEELDKEM